MTIIRGSKLEGFTATEVYTGTNLSGQVLTLSHKPSVPLIAADYTEDGEIWLPLEYTVSNKDVILETIVPGIPKNNIRIIYTVGKVSTDTTLKVGDLQIGSVEIKDADSDERVNLAAVGPTNALLTRDIINYKKSNINIYGDANISPGSEQTIATFSVPLGKTFYFNGAIIGGNSDGEFRIQTNSSTKALIRNSASARTIIVKFWNEIQVSEGGSASILVKNIGRQNRQFEATLGGYTI